MNAEPLLAVVRAWRAVLLLVVLAVLALPAAASAEVWHPVAAPDGVVPIAPIASGPLVFPARGAPRIIVGVAAGADVDAVAALLRPLASSLTILRPVGEIALQASNGAAVADLAARDPRIAFAEPDRSLHAFADPADSIDASTGVAFDWQYDAVQAGPAIAAVGGGSSTVVAVVDSGVDQSQPDLAGRLLPGFDATGTDGTVFDHVGHGTFVAGLVSMVDGNGIGGKGVAGNTRVLPVRATVDGTFTDAALISAITWAADNGAGVINLSLGGPTDDASLDRAIDYAASKNALVVVSSGNSNTTDQQDVTEYPAGYVGGMSGGWSIGLSVAATMPNGQVGSFSTHNAEVSIAAPGASGSGCSFGVFSTIPVSTLSTEWDDPTDPCNSIFLTDVSNPLLGRFAYGEGTSFSAPIVSGVAALARQANPALTPGQLADVLRRSATQTMGTGWNEYTGAGVVNAAAAVTLARAYDTVGPTLAFTAVPKIGGVQTDLTATDVAGPGEAAAGGLTIGLEESRDGITYGPYVLPGPAPVHQLIAATVPIWLRATACDANRNCTQQVLGAVTQLTAPVAPPSKAHASVQLRILGRKHHTLQLRVALGPGATGTAIVQVESWTGKTWVAFGRVTVPFGKSRTVTSHVTKKGRYRLRAHVLAGSTFLAAFSGPVSLRVR